MEQLPTEQPPTQPPTEWLATEQPPAERVILRIARLIRNGRTPDARELERLIRQGNRGVSDNARHVAKRDLLPFYRQVRRDDPTRWESWGIDPATEAQLLRVLQLKPRRTASGVATVAVLTKPWPCGGRCAYCPNDVRMPKSYLYNEPACQRAEHNRFDPYLQVATRLRTLSQMGHQTQKVELIVLGGTWDDYPAAYRIWFVEQLFRALNDGDASWEKAQLIRARYQEAGISGDPEDARARSAQAQRAVDAGTLGYNQAVRALYQDDPAWQRMAASQTSTLASLCRQQRINETAAHRMVGLVVETRPDAVTPQSLTFMRQLGCTKVQLGVQGIRQDLLDANGRGLTVDRIRQSFRLARTFGFKIHAHIMVNLRGATPQADRADYAAFVTSPDFAPDEVKLYPCALIDGTELMRAYREGRWSPYAADDLVDLLVDDVMATPQHVRVSRMIRDIPSGDIVAGNKVTNLRQLVEARIAQRGLASSVREIRMREVATGQVELASLALTTEAYQTTVSDERFIQWVTPTGGIAGFCRLSLPSQDYVRAHAADLPVGEGEAMIREVHVYGRAARLGQGDANAQHHGLGRQLVEEACRQAREAGYARINVISAVGTRAYYRGLGFADAGLYQRRVL